MKRALILLAGLVSLGLPGASAAGDVWVGVYDHDVHTPLTFSGFEPGVDVQAGWRGERLETWRWAGRPSPYVFVSGNTGGATNFAAVGLSWRFGDKVFFRPGLGLAVHDGADAFDAASDRIWFGSRVLFEPEVAVGWQASERLALEASWVHISHAQLLSRQNPGMDTFGARLTYKLR